MNLDDLEKKGIADGNLAVFAEDKRSTSLTTKEGGDGVILCKLKLMSASRFRDLRNPTSGDVDWADGLIEEFARKARQEYCE